MCTDPVRVVLQKVVESAARKEAEDLELKSIVEMLSPEQQVHLVRVVQAVAEHSRLFHHTRQQPTSMVMTAIQAAVRPAPCGPMGHEAGCAHLTTIS